MNQEDVDKHVEAGMQAVNAALANQPFRAEPSWADLRAAVEAALRFMIGGPPEPAEAETEQPPTGDQT